MHRTRWPGATTQWFSAGTPPVGICIAFWTRTQGIAGEREHLGRHPDDIKALVQSGRQSGPRALAQ